MSTYRGTIVQSTMGAGNSYILETDEGNFALDITSIGDITDVHLASEVEIEATTSEMMGVGMEGPLLTINTINIV